MAFFLGEQRAEDGQRGDRTSLIEDLCSWPVLTDMYVTPASAQRPMTSSSSPAPAYRAEPR